MLYHKSDSFGRRDWTQNHPTHPTPTSLCKTQAPPVQQTSRCQPNQVERTEMSTCFKVYHPQSQVGLAG
ncbi:hypothetical protein CPB83DRAFT_69680 [Crepidotus variabilis]|uniref:Uncharacterized protein n=1 Tax=Crepidotus variabilis TaxID=179855 RepID=A0A9P6E5M2_9AGAR|nr:hypothetical protein CPB83DRAFT_69680 [Crepidotus variabilis]